jgi:hypothetical protein
MSYNTTTTEETETDNTATDIQTSSLANEVVWNIGGRDIKFWEMLIGVLLLITFLPMIFRKRSKNN